MTLRIPRLTIPALRIELTIEEILADLAYPERPEQRSGREPRR